MTFLNLEMKKILDGFFWLCAGLPLCWSASVLVCQYASVLVCQCAGVWVKCQCAGVPMCWCANVLLCQCVRVCHATVLVCHCADVPVCWWASVPVRWCASVPVVLVCQFAKKVSHCNWWNCLVSAVWTVLTRFLLKILVLT
jgi:hypothetical protein